MFNTTDVTSSVNTTHSYNVTRGMISASSQNLKIEPANNLGYGVGKIVRGSFDHLYHSWQKMWAQEPSSEKLAMRRQIMIYSQGLKECASRLDSTLDKMRKNPDDPSSFKRVQLVATDCALYLKPERREEFRAIQQKILQPLEEKISKLAHLRMRNTLRQLLPIVFQENNPVEGGAEKDMRLPLKKEALSTKPKRTLQQAGGWPASFDLMTLNGANGFKVDGLAGGDLLGHSVSTAGDFNGDGKADLVLGAYGANSGGNSDVGTAYVLFGQAGGWSAAFNLASLNGINGFKVDGLAVDDFLGISVNTAGDLNGDGIADLVLGADNASPGGRVQAGTAYVLFGKASGWQGTFNLTSLNGTNGFKVEGLATYDRLGCSVSTAGDLNGDGKTDLVLGAFGAAPGGYNLAGTAYVLFGQTSGWPPSFNLATLNGTNGFKVEGLAAGDYLGHSVSTAGDLNGDGIADLVLGAQFADPEGRSLAGTAYVLFGKARGWQGAFNLTSLNGTNGFKVDGLAAGDFLSWSVSTAGDLNGDSIADLALGANHASPGRLYAGTAYVLFGQTSGWPPSFNLTTLNGTNGFKVDGLSSVDDLGYSVSTAGDLNGDGKADLVLGAYQADPGGRTDAGTAYVLFGQTSEWPPSFNLTSLNGTNGFKIEGLAAGDELGYSVSTAGDFNGDGKADLVLGGPFAAPGGRSGAGTVYVLFESNASLPSTSSPSMISRIPPAPISPLLTPETTIGIAVGVGVPVVLASVLTVILVLRFKKKACFADHTRTIVASPEDQ